MSWIELRGTERLTVEIEGRLDPGRARELVAPLSLELHDGGACVSLLLFDMRGMVLRGAPGPSFDYGEALWRIGVVVDGAPCWFAVTCDLDHPFVRALGARLVRYPVRRARFTFGEPLTETAAVWPVRMAAEEGELSVRAVVSEREVEATPPRRIFVRGGDRLFRIPWQEDPAPFRRLAEAEVAGSLGDRTFGAPVSFRPGAVVHHGRVHRCGVARRAC